MTLPQIPSLEIPQVDVYEHDMAVILNGVVYQVINVSPQTAALYNEQPKFVQVDRNLVREGHLYDEATGTFSVPQE